MGDSATGRAEGRLRVWLTVMMFILGVDRGCCRRRRIFSWVFMVRRLDELVKSSDEED